MTNFFSYIAFICLSISPATNLAEIPPTHGFVGFRPIPADEAGTKHDHGRSWEGMPTLAQQKDN